MKGCRQSKGLIAESLYQTLGSEDQIFLDNHVRVCVTCKDDLESLGELVSAIPAEKVALTYDLTPTIIARTMSAARAPRQFPLLWTGLGAVAALLIALATPFSPLRLFEDQGIRLETPAPTTPIQLALNRSGALATEGNFTGAYLVLNETYDNHTEDEASIELLQSMADLAYTDLKWYPEAYDVLLLIRNQHYDAFRNDEQSIFRLNLLDEARGPANRFRALLALDQARSADSFEDYEQVIQKFPATYTASVAAAEMAQTLAIDQQDDSAPTNLIQVMASAIEQCTNPIAVSQLQLELAHLYRSQPDKTSEARALYEEVTESDSLLLASRARQSLMLLAAAGTP